MAFRGFSFGFWRILQIITLIPTLGMLAYFVDFYTTRNLLTPRDILILFIVSVLGAAWTLGTLFLYARARHSAAFVAFVDLLFVGAFIGAVYELRGIADADCSHFERDTYSVSLGDWFGISGQYPRLVTNKECAMLKASLAFGIMNCIFFFLTFLLALSIKSKYEKRETHHVSRHAHRSPRRSHHSSRRSSHYV
ncbi:uncharacterized protein EI97DRAFT_423888 [Westerdykella ornata]|uniref:MARVEL domain-containing protein n=1 Tax=Westerdykella ornata TaxID=318751 RepID=A0A6A6JAR2_WESOR|nr:uncharacterized protein EI97DRAFT_423888 [Westerdykella ornata]KAF2273690.1 hypothetical protein EI97DRAFT_423888 [Westerdykella ornata]